MPTGKHSSGDDPARIDGAHQPAHEAAAGEPDDVVMVEHLLTPGDPVPHMPPADHARYAYVLEGQVAARIGAETLIAGPGSIVSIPRGSRHSLRSADGAAARVVVVHVRETEPGGPSQRRAA